MTSLSMTATDRCPLCGCRLVGFNIGSYRINKNSFVSTGSPPIRVGLPKCRECQFETEAPPSRWQLEPESQAKVDAYRAKKGWT